MPRKRTLSRKKKAPTTITDNDIDDNPEEEEQQQRDTASSSSSSEENKESSAEETDKEKSTSNISKQQVDDNTMLTDEDGASTANNTSVVLDPNDHDLSSSDEGKEDEINHPTTTSPLFRRRTSTANKNNNHRQSSSSSPPAETDPTSPSSPSTLQIANHSPSKTNTTTLASNTITAATSEGNNHNSQDVLIKKTRTTRRKPLQSPITKKQDDNNTSDNDEDKTTTIEQPSESSNESSSTSTAADTTTSLAEDTNNNKMEDDDAFLTHKSDYDSDEVIIETPKKTRANKRGRTPLPKSTTKDTDEPKSTEEATITTSTTSEPSSADEKEQKEMDTTEEDTTTSVVKRTPTRTRITKSTKRKAAAAASSSESDSDNESTKGKSKQRKLDSRPQRKRGMETPVSQRGNPTTPQPSPGLARPRKLDVSKKLLILRGSDLKNLASLKKKVTAAINEAKKAANKASPKRPDSDVSRLSGNLTDLDLKLLTDESISTGTVTLIDSTSQSNKRYFRDADEYDEFKEFRDGTMIHIDIPNVRIIEEEPAGPPFKRTSEFIKYEDPDRYDRSTLTLNPIPAQADFDMYSHRKIDISVEYNIESEDEEWLNNYNKDSRYPLSEKDFESIIALMNRASKNGKSCWFSVASVIELSRFFDARLEERHIVQVKKLWESKYNPQHKLFKSEELQKRIENENLLYEYMCVKQQLNTYKERVEQIMGISEQKKELLDKHSKLMKRKNYSVTKDFPKFVTKYSKLTYDEETETNSDDDESGDISNKLEEEQILKDSFPADQVEIELFIAEEKKEEEERKKSNQKVTKSWKNKGCDNLEEQHDESTLESTEFNSSSNEPYSPLSSVPSSLASLIIPPLPPILTKNLSNIQTPESTSTNIDTPTSAISNSDDLHSTKRRTRKKRMDSGTPTSNVSRTPTSASNMDFQQSFDESSSLISSPTPSDIVPPLLEASSPLPSPNNNGNMMRRRKKRSKIVIN